jgi:hypothetical protein
MKMIPPYLPFGLESWAEGKLFDKLREIDLPGYTALHSLRLANHPTKREAECDFVIVSPYGMYVLEVKGGGIRCSDGIWTSTGRSGLESTLKESPFKQASTARYALENELWEKSMIRLNDLVVGYGVVFPDTEFSQRSPEWDLGIVCSASHMSQIRGYLNRLEAYWLAKTHSVSEPLSQQRVELLVQALRPKFDIAPSLRVETDEVVARLNHFTEEQYRVLDGLEINDRFLVEGGAGTGKTFLALECARRHAANGQRTLLVCYSPVLAAFLQSRSDSPGVTIKSAHQLMLEAVRQHGGVIPSGYYPGMPITDPWFAARLIPAFEQVAPNIPEPERYDVLIVDEGQDILNADYLLALEHMLRGGFKDGIWRVFYDAYNQGAIFGKLDSDALDMLKAYAPRPMRLMRNCRNTTQIVEETKAATGADLDATSTSDGPRVETELYATPREGADHVASFLKKLLQGHVQGEEITILSPKPDSQSIIKLLPKDVFSKIKVLSGASAQQFPYKGITFATVADFKGLENNYILLVDIDSEAPGAVETANLYVGMTRARVRLWVASTHALGRSSTGESK